MERIIRKKRSALAMLAVHGADGCTPILLACKHGHLNLVRMLLKAGAKIDDRDRDPKRQGTPLHYAAWGGHLTIVQFLLLSGASLDELDIVGNTALLYAVYGGHRHVVEDLIRRGRSLHERNSKNHTVLLQASCGGHLDLVSWMLEEGFELTETDHDGNTSLLFAAWGGHLQLMHFLIEHDASLHEQNNNGHSVLLSAANGGRINVVEWLITQGFSLSETNNNGDTALLLAAYGGHRPLVEWLLARGASLDDRNGCGFTPLLSAANGGQLEMAAWLLKHGSTMTEADNDGYTSLILGACGGNIDLVNFFLENGANLSERNHNGDTALLLAAYCGHHDLVEWLLDNGSSLGERNNTGMGVLISAANGGNLEVVQLLLRRISEATALGEDCGDGMEHTDEGGYTPFLLAAQRGHLNVVQFLAAYGANIQARTSRHNNNAIALATDFPDVQKYVQEAWEWSPLSAAVDAQMTDRVHAMIQAGVNGPVVTAARKIATIASSYPNALPPSREIVGLLSAAVLPWSASRVELFCTGFNKSVHATLQLRRALLLDENRDDGKPILPLEIWLLIVSQFQRSWFTTKSPVQLQVGWVDPSSERVRLRWRQRHLLNQSVELDADELYHSGTESGDESATVFVPDLLGGGGGAAAEETGGVHRAVVGAGARVGGASSPAVIGGANGGGAAAAFASAEAQAAVAAAAASAAATTLVATLAAHKLEEEEEAAEDQAAAAAAEGLRSSRARNSTSEHSATVSTELLTFKMRDAADAAGEGAGGAFVEMVVDAAGMSSLPGARGPGAAGSVHMGKKVATLAEDLNEDGQHEDGPLGLPYRVSWI